MQRSAGSLIDRQYLGAYRLRHSTSDFLIGALFAFATIDDVAQRQASEEASIEVRNVLNPHELFARIGSGMRIDIDVHLYHDPCMLGQ